MTDTVEPMTLERVAAALHTIAQYVGAWDDDDITEKLHAIANLLEQHKTEPVAELSLGHKKDALGSRVSFVRVLEAGKQLDVGTHKLYTHPQQRNAVKVTTGDAERACAAMFDGWETFHQHEREKFRKDMRKALSAVASRDRENNNG